MWVASKLIRYLPDFWSWSGAQVNQDAGWTLCGTCTNPPPTFTRIQRYYTTNYVGQTNPPLNCNQSNNCVAGFGLPVLPPVANPFIKYDVWVYPVSSGERGQMKQTWYRNGAPAWLPGMPTTTIKPLIYDTGYIHRYNSVHSFYQPILKFAEQLKEVPFAAIPNRSVDPLGNSERGNHAPNEMPVSRPQASYVPRPLAGVLRIQPHIRNVAYGRTKEKKFQGSSQAVQEFFRVVSRAKESVTEFKDFLEAWIEALPKELQKVPKKGKFATIQEMLQHIYNNLDKVDAEQLMKNLAYNYVEDKVIGAGIKAGDKFAKAVGLKATTQIRSVTLPKWSRI